MNASHSLHQRLGSISAASRRFRRFGLRQLREDAVHQLGLQPGQLLVESVRYCAFDNLPEFLAVHHGC